MTLHKEPAVIVSMRDPPHLLARNKKWTRVSFAYVERKKKKKEKALLLIENVINGARKFADYSYCQQSLS